MSDRNSVNGTANGGLGDVLLGTTHVEDAAVREPAPSLHDEAVRNGGFDGELHRPAHLGAIASHTNETSVHDTSHNIDHAYGHIVHSSADTMDLITDTAQQGFDSTAATDNSGSQIWTPQYAPLESRGADHLADQQFANELSGAHSNGAPPPAVSETGQLWEADAGTTSGNPDGHSDVRLEHDDSDGQATDQIDEHDFSSAGALNSVGLDTAADLWFTVDNNDVLHVGHISTGAEIGTGTTIGSTSDQDLVWSMVVDPRHDVIYEELFGGDYNVVDAGEGGRQRGGEIIKISYNPATGAISTPYNPTTFANNTSDILADSGSSNNTIALVRSMALSSDGSTMYFVDDNDADPGSYWGFKTNGIFSMSTSGSVGGGNAPTPTLLTDTSQFNTTTSGGNYTTPYITGLAVNNAQGIIYFTTDASGENTNTSADAIWWMPITGGTATKMTLPGGVTLDYDAFFSSGVIFDPEGRQLYVSDVQRDAIIQLTLSADGHSFISGNNDFRTVDANGDGAFTSSMTWDSLPVLGNINGTSTEAVQGGSAITLLNGTPTISDPDGTGLNLNKAQVVIANAQTGDVLTATTAGTNIVANYNTTTHILTLSGDDTYAHYEQVLNSVQFQDTGTDNSTGSHPTRTINFIISDGTTIVSQTTADPNEKAITLVIDRAPTLTADNYSPVQESGTQLGTSGTAGTGVLGNDNDKDGDAIVVTAVNGNGGNVNNFIAGTYGHLQLNANGSFEYDATITSAIDSAALGSHPIDTFTYTVSDGLGGVTTTTVSFTINRAPTVTADAPASQALESGSAVNGNVLTNDSDKDGDSLVVSAVNGVNGNVGLVIAGTYGQIQINADGSYSYSANNAAAIDGAATGSHLTDTFTYTASDGHQGFTTTTVVVTIDRAPTVVVDAGAAVESSSGSGNVLTNDSDRDGDTLVVSAVNGSSGNVGHSVAGTYGHIQINADGSYSYNADNTAAIDSAATGSHLTDTFTYTASDGDGGTTTTTVTITLDRAPTVVADANTAVESGSDNGNVLTNDSDRDGDTLVVSAVNGVSGNVGSNIATTYGHIQINADGSYTYAADDTAAIDGAATGSHLTDTISYTASDGHGGTTTTNIVITLDRAPTVVADAGAAVESSSGSGNVLTNDSDRDGDTLVVSAVNGNAGGVGSSVAGTYGHIQINADGSYTYNADNTAAIDSAATGSHLTDTFTYTASDGHGGTTTTNVVITLDRAPTVVTDSANDTEGGTITTNAAAGVLANDSDRDGDSLTVSAITGGSVGSSVATTYGHITMNADGSYSYVADNTAAIDAAANGSHPVDTITFTVDDGHGGTTTETLSITIDRPAVAAADSLDTTENAQATVGSGSPVNANLLANDVDKDGDAITITAVNGSAGNVGTQIHLASGALLTVNADGTYTYDPNHAFDYLAASGSGASDTTATDTFTYTIDGGSTVTVTITINGVDSNDTLVGTSGNDTLIAGIGNDIIYDDNGLNAGKDPHDTSAGHSGGTDSFSGGSGNDAFYMGGNLTAADSIDGGTGTDRVVLDGDYSAGLVFTATTMVNVEALALVAGHSYNLTIDNATVAAGQTMKLQAATLGAGDNVTFDASNDTTGGRYIIITGAGNDVLTGGAGNDIFRSGAGNDTINGGGGNDKINMAGNLTAADLDRRRQWRRHAGAEGRLFGRCRVRCQHGAERGGNLSNEELQLQSDHERGHRGGGRDTDAAGPGSGCIRYRHVRWLCGCGGRKLHHQHRCRQRRADWRYWQRRLPFGHGQRHDPRRRRQRRYQHGGQPHRGRYDRRRRRQRCRSAERQLFGRSGLRGHDHDQCRADHPGGWQRLQPHAQCFERPRRPNPHRQRRRARRERQHDHRRFRRRRHVGAQWWCRKRPPDRRLRRRRDPRRQRYRHASG